MSPFLIELLPTEKSYAVPFKNHLFKNLTHLFKNLLIRLLNKNYTNLCYHLP